MEYVLPVMGAPFGLGVLSATQQVVSMNRAPVPCTVTLASTAGGRLIELSSDGGNNYFTPVYDANTTPMINVSVGSPISHVRYTGSIGDNWSIR